MIFFQCISIISYIILAINFCNIFSNVCTFCITEDWITLSICYIILVEIRFIKRLTGHLVYTFECINEEVIAVSAFHILLGTINDTFLSILFRQFKNLVLNQRSVSGKIDSPILVLEDVHICIDFPTTVRNSTDVSQNCSTCTTSFCCTG